MIHVEDDFEHLAADDESLVGERRIKAEFPADATQTILTTNDTPPKSPGVEDRTILLISACKRRRSSVKYRPFASFQNSDLTVRYGS